MFCSFTEMAGAKTLFIAPFVTNNVHQNVMLSDMSEFIQEKNPFLANCVIIQQFRKYKSEHIWPKITYQIPNLYKVELNLLLNKVFVFVALHTCSKIFLRFLIIDFVICRLNLLQLKSHLWITANMRTNVPYV